VLPHDDGKRGTVLLTVAVITATMTLKLRFDYVSKYRDPCHHLAASRVNVMG
jgi:hypothetical protein